MNKRVAFLAVLLIAAVPLCGATPVLVELFTSEGCSSCPPADALLEKLQGPDVIVLSEHVDYWNHIGWKDPYSSPQYSQRQNAYASRLHLDSVYTPQMVVDGSVEFVGSDANQARAAINTAAKAIKTNVRVTREGETSRVKVEVDGIKKRADVYLALASNEEVSKVLRGENRGRSLHHVAVVRSLRKIGSVQGNTAFSKEIDLPASLENIPAAKLRVVAIVQEEGQGRIFGCFMLPLA